MQGTTLTLYVAGGTARADLAVQSLRRACAELIPGGARLEVVDVLADPERGLSARIHVTPTVVLDDARRGARAFGDLSDPREVVWSLGLGG